MSAVAEKFLEPSLASAEHEHCSIRPLHGPDILHLIYLILAIEDEYKVLTLGFRARRYQPCCRPRCQLYSQTSSGGSPSLLFFCMVSGS